MLSLRKFWHNFPFTMKPRSIGTHVAAKLARSELPEWALYSLGPRSSLDTICVSRGVRCAAISDGVRSAISSFVKKPVIDILNH